MSEKMPVAWRYQRKEWDALLWRYQTEALVNDDFETPGDWTIEPLYAIPAPPQPGRDAVIEDVYACCESTLIGFSDELTEQQRKFICDQVSRKVALALTGEPK